MYFRLRPCLHYRFEQGCHFGLKNGGDIQAQINADYVSTLGGHILNVGCQTYNFLHSGSFLYTNFVVNVFINVKESRKFRQQVTIWAMQDIF